MTVEKTCHEVESLIDDLIDGALDGARERAVRGHIRACERCARHYDETSQLVEAARELGAGAGGDAPPELWHKLSARLDDDEIQFSDKPRLWWWWHAWRGRIAVGMVALCGAAAVAGFFALRKGPTAPAVVKVDTGKMYKDAVADVARAGDEYERAVDELRDIVGKERARWRPEVAAEFDRNLAIIDAAVERQREITREVPGDLGAQDALAESYRREIAFLQEAVVRGDAR